MQTKFESMQAKPSLSSMQIAKLVLSSYNGKLPLKIPYSKNLATEEDSLAYWLNYKSFLKYKIEQLACKYKMTGEDNFPEGLKFEVKKFLDEYIELKQKKKQLPKLVLEDFAITNYIELRSKKEKIRSITVTPELTRALLAGLNRIRKAIGIPIPLEEITTKDYAPRGTVYKLAKKMRELKPGQRKQFVYYHGNNNHAIAFDVENRGGNLNIFCFDSSKDESQLEAIDLLIENLEKNKVKFEIKSCQAGIQKDEMNCSVFSILALKELAKYDHVFDFIPEKYEEDESLKKKTKASVSVGFSDREATLRNMGKVGWIKVKDMPTRMISMGQSYDEMKKNLEESKQFDLDAGKFCQAHKDYLQIEKASDNEKKLVIRKRRLIDERSKTVLEADEKRLFEKHLESIPGLSFIKENRDLNLNEILQDKKMVNEKLELIERIFLAIFDIYKIGDNFNSQSNPLPSHVLRAILNLRNEFLTLVCTSDEDIKSKYLFTFDKRPILSFPLDSKLSQSQFERGNIPSAMSILLSNLSNKGERRKFFRKFSTPDLRLGPVAFGNPIQESVVRKQLEEISDKFGYDKSAKDDAFEQAEFMLKKLSGYHSRDVFYNLIRYNDKTPILIRKEAELQLSSNSNNRNVIQNLAADKYLPAYVYTDEGNLYYLDQWDNRDLISKITITQSQQKKILELFGDEIFSDGNREEARYIEGNQAIKLLNHNSYMVEGSRKETLKTLAFMLNIELDYLGIMYEKDKGKAIASFDIYFYQLFKRMPSKTFEETVLSQLNDTQKKLFFTLIRHREDLMEGRHDLQSNSQTRKPGLGKPSFIETFLTFFSISSKDSNEGPATHNSLKGGDENSVVAYYEKVQSDSGSSSKSFMNFSMSTFSNQWVVYNRSNLIGVNLNKSDWKINLSIHQNDIIKALPIIAKIALDHNLGSFKVMYKKYADECQNKKTMKGREFVFFNCANPDFDGV